MFYGEAQALERQIRHRMYRFQSRVFRLKVSQAQPYQTNKPRWKQTLSRRRTQVELFILSRQIKNCQQFISRL